MQKQRAPELQSLRRRPNSAGFTLLEIIIVIGLIAYLYSVAVPNFNLQSGSEVATRLGRLSEDIKSAFDYSVLTGKPARMVFQLYTGEYWLETTDASNVKIGDKRVAHDPLPDEEKHRQEEFDAEMKKYIALAGEAVKGADNDEDIPVETPLTKALDKLRGPTWYAIDSLEWQKRNLGDHLLIGAMQAEHHEKAVTLEELGKDAYAYLYFMPGYVEKCVMHVYYKLEDGKINPDEKPYTIFVHPYEGYADVRSGLEEISVHEKNSGPQP